MPRYRLTIEYDGGGFVGWQRQDNGPSVQAALEDSAFRFCGVRPTIVGAGRTDAGVHALGQVAHVDLDRAFPATTVRDAMNFHLKPALVVVRAADAVGDGFHARFSAVGRHYRYRILNRPSPPALARGRVWWIPIPLDVDAMRDAARALLGRHDFSAFRAALCQARSPVKTLDRLDIRQAGDEILIEAHARSFLHNQVRIIAGTLKRVGEAKMTRADVAAALASGDRSKAGQTARPEGLYLVSVTYPPEAQDAAPLPGSVEGARDLADDQAQHDVDDDNAGGGQRRDGQR
jgi:tRNA pseudouridine38-40 synthase